MSTKRTRRKVASIVGSTVLVAGVAAATYTALDAYHAGNELRQAMPLAGDIKTAALAGDTEGLDERITELAQHTGAAREYLHGPHWTIAAKLPFIGDDIEAVQTVASAVDDLASGPLSDLATVADLPDLLRPEDGRIDVDRIAALAGTVTSAHDTVVAANDAVQAIDTSTLISQLAGPVTQAQEQVGELAGLTATAATAAQVAPAILGADGPRDYLLLAQNNAEPRAAGGLNGAIIHLRAHGGELEVAGQRAASEFPVLDQTITPLDVETEHLFGTHVGRYMQNVTATPDFPTTGQLAADLWLHHTGQEVDGVAAIDPVALGLVIGATSPVQVGGGVELTGQNTAQALLNQVYLDIADPAEQDEFFERAATAAFDRLLDGGSDAFSALREAAAQNRVKLWSAHPREQDLLEQTSLSGKLVGRDGDRPVVGVYLNDRSGAKVGYYQDVDIQVESLACHDDGSQDLAVSVTLTSTLPSDLIGKVPYLTGGGIYIPEGQIHTQLLVYAPTGGRFTAAHPAQGDEALIPATHGGLSVISQEVALEPGQSATATFHMTSGPDLPGKPALKHTPGPSTHESSMSPESACR